MPTEAVLWMGLGVVAASIGFMVVRWCWWRLTSKKHRAILRGSPTRDFKY